jgi:hypothetical protein
VRVVVCSEEGPFGEGEEYYYTDNGIKRPNWKGVARFQGKLPPKNGVRVEKLFLSILRFAGLSTLFGLEDPRTGMNETFNLRDFENGGTNVIAWILILLEWVAEGVGSDVTRLQRAERALKEVLEHHSRERRRGFAWHLNAIWQKFYRGDPSNKLQLWTEKLAYSQKVFEKLIHKPGWLTAAGRPSGVWQPHVFQHLSSALCKGIQEKPLCGPLKGQSKDFPRKQVEGGRSVLAIDPGDSGEALWEELIAVAQGAGLGGVHFSRRVDRMPALIHYARGILGIPVAYEESESAGRGEEQRAPHSRFSLKDHFLDALVDYLLIGPGPGQLGRFCTWAFERAFRVMFVQFVFVFMLIMQGGGGQPGRTSRISICMRNVLYNTDTGSEQTEYLVVDSLWGDPEVDEGLYPSNFDPAGDYSSSDSDPGKGGDNGGGSDDEDDDGGSSGDEANNGDGEQGHDPDPAVTDGPDGGGGGDQPNNGDGEEA